MPIFWQHQLLHELIFKSSVCAGMVFPKKFFLSLVRNWRVSRSIQVALSPGKTPFCSDLALEKAKYFYAFMLWRCKNLITCVFGLLEEKSELPNSGREKKTSCNINQTVFLKAWCLDWMVLISIIWILCHCLANKARVGSQSYWITKAGNIPARVFLSSSLVPVCAHK